MLWCRVVPLSRASSSAEREQLLDKLQENAVVKGVVKNLTDYGAFVDLGGIDGLLHITDMAWKRVRHPSEVVNVGDELDVRVLKFDRERNRVSLGLKQLGEDPWVNITRRYPADTRILGKISNVTDYGCFVELEPGVEGLVHVSEMDWTNKNVNPGKMVQVGDEVEVMVLDVDEERRRISLGMKQTRANPWEAFAAIYKKNDKVTGQIKSITDFGIFVGLDGGIDGLVHLSDISWQATGEELVRNFKKGDDLEAVVLAVDPERERISLGLKQLEQDPFGQYMAANPRSSIVKGTAREVDAKGVTVDLAEGVEGYMKANDIAKERVDDATLHYKVGDPVEAKFHWPGSQGSHPAVVDPREGRRRAARRARRVSGSVGSEYHAGFLAQGKAGTLIHGAGPRAGTCPSTCVRRLADAIDPRTVPCPSTSP